MLDIFVCLQQISLWLLLFGSLNQPAINFGDHQYWNIDPFGQTYTSWAFQRHFNHTNQPVYTTLRSQHDMKIACVSTYG